MKWHEIVGKKEVYSLCADKEALHDALMGEASGSTGHCTVFPHISVFQKYMFVYMYTQTFIRRTHKTLVMVSGERDEGNG